ncbi:MAG TPA: tetratricopeptide repeat protein [Bryobacteraceae bacterium]|nr:tetratricopeptide repeat protein [Bryobacteraceae bacterium]
MTSVVPIRNEPEFASAASPPRVLIIEAPAGAARRRWMEQRLAERAQSGARTWIACCDFDSGGPWAGANTFFWSIFEEIQAQKPDLTERHAAELVQVLPQLKSLLEVGARNLTDTAQGQERVRNYAADRAFRFVHGLIDLLDSWKSAMCPDIPWAIACDDFDKAGRIGGYFFRELLRRRGERLRLSLLAGVGPGEAEGVRASFHAAVGTRTAKPNLPGEAPRAIDREAAAREATEIEEKIGDDFLKKQVQVSDLIRLWRCANRPDKLFRWKGFAMTLYLHQGLYQDALRVGEGLLDLLPDQGRNDPKLRLWTIMKFLNGYMGMQDAPAGIRFAESVALKELEDGQATQEHIQLCFLIAMLYARYQKPRDYGKGEGYLDRGIALIKQSDLPEEDRHFEYVFNRNGVAMIRNFQGSFQAAIDLCRAGIERLNMHLGSDKHRLHRSVLVYNIAQVYFVTGAYAEAIENFTAVMAMDPNYSEYYNERGNIFLRVGRLEEARADYLRAIELSAPYYEVFTNLGQCYRRMGAMPEAIEAYSRALDLEPNQALALAGRAKAHEELGDREAAIADYSAALARDPKQWEAFASRGVLRYEAGDLDAALRDFDRAAELAPDQAGLYQNRSIVLQDLGRPKEAVRDLETALRLSASEEQRQTVQERLETALSAAY